MKGLGTILNAALILVGGGAGLLVGKRIRPQMRDTLMTVTGVAVNDDGRGRRVGADAARGKRPTGNRRDDDDDRQPGGGRADRRSDRD